jgi:endoribonuclease Dicer
MDPAFPVLPPSQPGLDQDNRMDVDETVDSPKRAIINLEEHDSTDDRGEDTDRENDDEGETKKWIVNPPPKRRKISERKRADNAAFDTWIQNNHQNLSKCLSKLIVDDDKTVQSLVKDFENRRIITSPRDYQLELFERAKTQNTIAVLDTGRSYPIHV